MFIAKADVQHMGVDEGAAAIRFGEGPKPEGTRRGNRLLWLGDRAAFELTFWCGTRGLRTPLQRRVGNR